MRNSLGCGGLKARHLVAPLIKKRNNFILQQIVDLTRVQDVLLVGIGLAFP
jgi:hypothetical protein